MKRHESRLEATEMAYLRRIVGVTRSDTVRNADVMETVNQEGGDGESEKETKSMEGETGADGRWQISEESVH